jgi:hypothetical protein
MFYLKFEGFLSGFFALFRYNLFQAFICQWKIDPECTSCTYYTLKAYISAQLIDQLFGNREANASPFNPAGLSAKPIKRLEYFRL